MSSTTQFERPARVSEDAFMGVAWGFTAVSLVFLVGRLYTRLHVHRRLYFDDYLVVFAWILLLANTAIWQHVARYLYEMSSVQAGLEPMEPRFEQHVHTYLMHSIAVIAFFYTGLWAIKLSFLVFFRRLGSMVLGQKIHWWVVFVFTVVTWIITFGTIQYGCLTGSLPYLIQHCASGYAVSFQRATLLYNMAMDVITDAAIITIPVHLLWNVRISLRQKLMLMGIFSLTVIIIIFAIVRASVITGYSNRPDGTWLYLWSSIEQGVSIIIACLASFRSLFVKYDPSQAAARHRDGVWSTWSPMPLLSRASKLFTPSHYRRSSTVSSNSTLTPSPKERLPFMDTTYHSTITATKSHVGTESDLQEGIRVTHETKNVSYPRQNSQTEEV